MSVPQFPSSEATAIAMSDFGIKKEAEVTITSVDGISQRPVFGRRKTPSKEVRSAIDAQKLDSVDREDSLTKVRTPVAYVLWTLR